MNGKELLAIGYRYNSKKTLMFVATELAGKTMRGTPYEMKFADEDGNVHVREVDRPDVISKFFKDSNNVDKHNQSRQSDLALEKKWITDDCWFHLATTYLGIGVTDTWKLAGLHNLLARHKETTITTFSGILSKQLINYAKKAELMDQMNIPISTRSRVSAVSAVSSLSSDGVREGAREGGEEQEGNDNELDYIEQRSKWAHLADGECMMKLEDANGVIHRMFKFPQTTGLSGKKYRKGRRCYMDDCENQTVYFCNICGPRCHKEGDSHFIKHVQMIKKRRGRRRN